MQLLHFSKGRSSQWRTTPTSKYPNPWAATRAIRATALKTAHNKPKVPVAIHP